MAMAKCDLLDDYAVHPGDTMHDVGEVKHIHSAMENVGNVLVTHHL